MSKKVYPFSLTQPCKNCGTPVTRICENFNQRRLIPFCSPACRKEDDARFRASKRSPKGSYKKRPTPQQKVSTEPVKIVDVRALKQRDEDYRLALIRHKLQGGGL